MASQTTETIKASPDLNALVRQSLEGEGFVFSDHPYAFFKASASGITVIYYQKGTIVLQGPGATEWSEFVTARLGGPSPEVIRKAIISAESESAGRENLTIACSAPSIGIDESGKGDFFGPLVVAAVHVDPRSAKLLAMEGVRDSKKMNDSRIAECATFISRVCPSSVIALGPEKYNDLYRSFRNLNRLLAWCHATVLENVLQRVSCSMAISDKFSARDILTPFLKERGKTIELVQETKGERHMSVAAASVLARARFVRLLGELSETAGTVLPKGCGPGVTAAARRIILSSGSDSFQRLAKTHFKTYQDTIEWMASRSSGSGA